MKKVKYFLVFLAITGAFSPLTSQAVQESKLSKLMADKLRYAQRLLEGIVMRDYPKITTSAEKLIQISNAAEWQAVRTPRYEVHSNEFRRAAEMIIRKAKDKNLDGVALSYVELTLSCVRCHDYVREVRDVRLPGPRPDLADVFAADHGVLFPGGKRVEE